MANRKPDRRIGLRVLTFALAMIFLPAGAAKLAGQPDLVKNFARWGYPGWFHLVIGGAEVALAVLVLIPGTAWIGAAGMVAIMLGAAYTHTVLEREPAAIAFTLVVAAMAAFVGWSRRPGTPKV